MQRRKHKNSPRLFLSPVLRVSNHLSLSVPACRPPPLEPLKPPYCPFSLVSAMATPGRGPPQGPAQTMQWPQISLSTFPLLSSPFCTWQPGWPSRNESLITLTSLWLQAFSGSPQPSACWTLPYTGLPVPPHPLLLLPTWAMPGMPPLAQSSLPNP